jgi:hypothetical protein
MTKAEIEARAKAQQTAIDAVAQRLRGKAEEIVKRFAGRSFTASEVFPEIDQAWRQATELHKVAYTLHNISKENLKRADDNVLRLLELRAQLKRDLTAPTRHTPGSEMWRKARDYQTAPLLWLIDVQRPILQRQIAQDKAVATAANLPGQAAGYLRTQASEALGLPRWFVPVVAGTVVLAVGARVVQVLAPVYRATDR